MTASHCKSVEESLEIIAMRLKDLVNELSITNDILERIVTIEENIYGNSK